jgi:hypothetical protein
MVKNKILFLFLFPPPPENILEKIREPNNKKSLALTAIETQSEMGIWRNIGNMAQNGKMGMNPVGAVILTSVASLFPQVYFSYKCTLYFRQNHKHHHENISFKTLRDRW